MSGNPTRIAPPRFDQRNEQHTRSSVETRIRGSESTLDNEVRLFKADLPLANGVNTDIELPSVARYLRVTGPSAGFSVNGFQDGYEGKRLIFYNPTAQTLTITNDATSVAANRILTLSGADVVLSGPCLAHFIYSVSDLRWLLESAHDGVVAIANGGTGATTALAAFDNLKQAATEVYSGVVELATTGEAATGTDTSRAVTAAGVLAAINAYFSAGAIVQSVYAEYTGTTGITATTPIDDSIPQIGEGIEVMTATLTPKSASNKLRIRARGSFVIDGSGVGYAIHIHRDATGDALAADMSTSNTGNRAEVFTIEYEATTGSTAATTIHLRAGVASSTMRPNGSAAPARVGGGAQRWTLVVEEVKG
jgi:hypothetical protein